MSSSTLSQNEKMIISTDPAISTIVVRVCTSLKQILKVFVERRIVYRASECRRHNSGVSQRSIGSRNVSAYQKWIFVLFEEEEVR